MKRFVETELWHKDWYLDLPIKLKLLLRYLYDNCDCVGVFEANYRMMSFCIGETVSANDIAEINKHRQIIEVLDCDRLFITDFCDFQYGELTPACKPHLKYIQLLKKYGLYQRVCKGYAKGMQTLEEKEKEEERREIVKRETLDVDNELEAYLHQWNVFCEQQTEKLAQIKEITNSRKNKLKARLKENAFDFAEILRQVKAQSFLVGDNKQGWTVSFDWIIENDKNYLKILEGNYKNYGGTNGRFNTDDTKMYTKSIKK